MLFNFLNFEIPNLKLKKRNQETISNYQINKNITNPKQSHFIISDFQISKFQITRPDFHCGVPKTYDVATKLISYERYGEILFQKVASGYLLHFVQDGS